MAYKRPDVRIVCTVQTFWDQRISMQVDGAAEMDWRAKKIIDFIDSHPGEVARNLDDLCKQLALPVSGRQARRVFRRATRIGFKEYLRKSRLAFAAEQLKATTTVPIKAIAADAGYERTAEFGRSFKRLFLLSPTEFRTVWGKNKFVA
jgi:methylphosphotriester-DNA--protein-cysteine methyltransferase